MNDNLSPEEEREFIERMRAEQEEATEKKIFFTADSIAKDAFAKLRAENKAWQIQMDAKVKAIEDKPAQILKTEKVIQQVEAPRPPAAQKWTLAVTSKERGLMQTVTGTSDTGRKITMTVSRTPDFFPDGFTITEDT